MKSFKWTLFFLLFPFFLCAKETFQSSPPVSISASFLEYEKKENIYIAKGNAELKEGNRIFKADLIKYYADKKELYAEGHVFLSENEIEIACEKLFFNNATKEGTIEKGKVYLKKGEYYIDGEEIKKYGENRYLIYKGGITTCGFDDPAWKIVAEKADVEIGAYAKVKHSRFQIEDFPFFFLPYMIFPIKTERQSGFLIPDVNLSSRNGLTIKNSYFWALSQDKDMTLMLDYMSKRGAMLGTEFRYAIKENLKGNWNGFILEDSRFGGTRYKIEGYHKQDFPKDIKLNAHMIHISDIEYLKDFGDSKEKREGLLKSFFYLEKFFRHSMVTSEFSYFKTLVTKENKETFKYLPFLSVSTDYIPLLSDRVFFNLYSDMINFYREKGNTYTRLAFEPKLNLPIYRRGLNITTESTFYETVYFVEDREKREEKDGRRETVKVDIDANVALLNHRSFIGQNLQELMRPYVKYTFIPKTSVKSVPYIDPYDRILSTNILTLGLVHDINLFADNFSKPVSNFEIQQSVGIDQKLSPSYLYSGYGEKFSDIKIRWNFYPFPDFCFVHESAINVYGKGVKTFKNTLLHKISGRYHIDITHNYVKDSINELYINIGGAYGQIDGRMEIRYSFKDHQWLDSTYRLIFKPKCYKVTLSFIRTKRPRDTSIRFDVDLIGITSRR